MVNPRLCETLVQKSETETQTSKKIGSVNLPNNWLSLNGYGSYDSLRVADVSLFTEINTAAAFLALWTVSSVLILLNSGCNFLFWDPSYKNSRLGDCSTCSEPEIPRLLFRAETSRLGWYFPRRIIFFWPFYSLCSDHEFFHVQEKNKSFAMVLL